MSHIGDTYTCIGLSMSLQQGTRGWIPKTCKVAERYGMKHMACASINRHLPRSRACPAPVLAAPPGVPGSRARKSERIGPSRRRERPFATTWPIRTIQPRSHRHMYYVAAAQLAVHAQTCFAAPAWEFERCGKRYLTGPLLRACWPHTSDEKPS